MLCDRTRVLARSDQPDRMRIDPEERQHMKKLRVPAKLLTKDEARRIAANFAKRPG